MYKPAANMTVYGTYGSSLQQGDLAPGTAANQAQALPPYRSTAGRGGVQDRAVEDELLDRGVPARSTFREHRSGR